MPARPGTGFLQKRDAAESYDESEVDAPEREERPIQGFPSKSHVHLLSVVKLRKQYATPAKVAFTGT